MKTFKQIFFASFLTFLLVGSLAVVVAPRPTAAGLFIGCNEETKPDGTFVNPCGFDDLMLQINKFITFLIFDLAMPLAAIAFCYAGFLFMTSGDSPGNREKAKGIFKSVLIGFVIALAAFLIVKTIMIGLGFKAGDGTGGTFQTFFK